jgi:hypothetical protein
MARTCAWFIPRRPPIIAFNAAAKNRIGLILCAFENGKIKRPKGPSFCHVHRIKQLIQERDVTVDGNQKWQGAAPSFSNNAITKSVCIRI